MTDFLGTALDDFVNVGRFVVESNEALTDRARVLGGHESFLAYLDDVRAACRSGEVTEDAIVGFGFVASLSHFDSFVACAESLRDCPNDPAEYN